MAGLTPQEKQRAERFAGLRAQRGHSACTKNPQFACENCCRIIFARACLRLDKEIEQLACPKE